MNLKQPLSFFLALVSSAAVAEEEKILNLYSWAEYVPQGIIQGFESEFGIRINFDTYDSDVILGAKLMAGSTGYDVVGMADPGHQRFIPIGLFRPLDKEKLPNLSNMDPEIMRMAAFSDPGNQYTVIYTWGSTGFGYDVDQINKRMPDAPLDSAAMIFDPAVVSRFADCGVSFLDDAGTMIRLALQYLGYDIDATDDEAFAAAERALKAVQPYVRYYSSVRHTQDLAARETCLAAIWSGDLAFSQNLANQAGIDINLAYTVPREGTNIWIDSFLMPADLPHPENAHLFLNYMMRPEVAAEVANYNRYAVGNRAALAYMLPEVRNNPAAYPPPEKMALIRQRKAYSMKVNRKANRIWARVKAGFE